MLVDVELEIMVHELVSNLLQVRRMEVSPTTAEYAALGPWPSFAAPVLLISKSHLLLLMSLLVLLMVSGPNVTRSCSSAAR